MVVFSIVRQSEDGYFKVSTKCNRLSSTLCYEDIPASMLPDVLENITTTVNCCDHEAVLFEMA